MCAGKKGVKLIARLPSKPSDSDNNPSMDKTRASSLSEVTYRDTGESLCKAILEGHSGWTASGMQQNENVEKEDKSQSSNLLASNKDVHIGRMRDLASDGWFCLFYLQIRVTHRRFPAPWEGQALSYGSFIVSIQGFPSSRLPLVDVGRRGPKREIAARREGFSLEAWRGVYQESKRKKPYSAERMGISAQLVPEGSCYMYISRRPRLVIDGRQPPTFSRSRELWAGDARQNVRTEPVCQ